PARKAVATGEAEQKGGDEEAAEGRGRIGRPEEPRRHRENNAMSDQRPGHPRTLVARKRREKSPQRPQPQNETQDPEAVLADGDAAAVGHPAPRAELPAELGQVLDEKDRERDQQETGARQELPHGGRRVA